MINTCLLTGERLDGKTSEEHTIPRGVGGRIRSRITFTSRINGLFGSHVDNHLAEKYKSIMVSLGPQLPSSIRVGAITGRGEETKDQYRIDGGLCRHREKLHIVRDPITNKPIEIIGPNERQIVKMLKQAHGDNIQIETTWANEQDEAVGYPVTVVSPEIEIATLKAGIASMDCKYLKNKRESPIRSLNLNQFRNDLLLSIESQKARKLFLAHHCKGIQVNRIAKLKKLLPDNAIEYGNLAHYVILSGCVETKTLDLIVYFFGIDPMGFRLSQNWSERSFTSIISHPLIGVKGRDNIEFVERLGGETLCGESSLRSSAKVSSSSHEYRIEWELFKGLYIDLARKVNYESLKVRSYVKIAISYSSIYYLRKPFSAMLIEFLSNTYHPRCRHRARELLATFYLERHECSILYELVNCDKHGQVLLCSDGFDQLVDMHIEGLEFLKRELGFPDLMDIGDNPIS